MCTPLMAQRCLLHQAALAEGSGSYSRADVQHRLPAGSQGDERDEQIVLGIKKKKDNSRNMFDVLQFAYAGAPSSQRKRT